MEQSAPSYQGPGYALANARKGLELDRRACVGHGVESATLSSVVPDLWLCTVQGCTACIQSSVMEQLVRYRRTRVFLANHTKLQFEHKAFEYVASLFAGHGVV